MAVYNGSVELMIPSLANSISKGTTKGEGRPGREATIPEPDF